MGQRERHTAGQTKPGPLQPLNRSPTAQGLLLGSLGSVGFTMARAQGCSGEAEGPSPRERLSEKQPYPGQPSADSLDHPAGHPQGRHFLLAREEERTSNCFRKLRKCDLTPEGCGVKSTHSGVQSS